MISSAVVRRLFIIFLLTACVCFSGCSLMPKPDPKSAATDAERFKLEHENLNGSKTSFFGKKYRIIEIPADNPIIYSSYSGLVDKMENGETFVAYFGFSACPWCRSEIETTLGAASENQIGTIYYVDVQDTRDTYELQDGSPVKTKEPADGYYELLKLMESALDDYMLTDDDDNKIATGEKRIYAPTVVMVKEGKIYARKSGSEHLTDPHMELTDEIRADMKEKASNFFSGLK